MDKKASLKSFFNPKKARLEVSEEKKSSKDHKQNKSRLDTMSEECTMNPDFILIRNYLNTNHLNTIDMNNVPTDVTWDKVADLNQTVNEELRKFSKSHEETKELITNYEEFYKMELNGVQKLRDMLYTDATAVLEIESKIKEMESELQHLQPYTDLMDEFISDSPTYNNAYELIDTYSAMLNKSKHVHDQFIHHLENTRHKRNYSGNLSVEACKHFD